MVSVKQPDYDCKNLEMTILPFSKCSETRNNNVPLVIWSYQSSATSPDNVKYSLLYYKR